MITGSIHLKFEYESTRMGRYDGIKTGVYYSKEELLNAYAAWANHAYGREKQWNEYCDIRDGVPIGTNRRICRKREMH